MESDKRSEVTAEQWSAMRQALLIDTRSPSEFAQGHIPGAVNLPLFDDTARAEIGTLYKQQGKGAAVDRGLELVGPQLAQLTRAARRLVSEAPDPSAPVIVHCWRGGMRSESMVWLLRLAGIPARKLTGGYKAYRKWTAARLADLPELRILAGPTGTGKTPILRELAALGAQVLDLEGIARHLGSAFGNLDRHDQPSSEQFANDCYEAVRRMDAERPVWLEDESRKIGTVHLPEGLYRRMRTAQIVRLERSKSERLDEIERIYGGADPATLEAAFRRITDKLGGLATRQAIAHLAAGEIRPAAAIGLRYYDKLYAHTMERHARPIAHIVDGKGKEFPEIASILNDL